jgi:hypothetical protein
MFSSFFENDANTSSPPVIIAEYPSPYDFENEPTDIDDADEDARAFLNRLSCDPDKVEILNALIQYGAIPDGIFLTNLVAFEFPLDTIRQMYDTRFMSHGYDYGSHVIADYFLFAAFHKDPNVLNFFMDKHTKDEVSLTLRNLNMMKEWAATGLRLTVHDKQRIFSSASCQAAILRLLKSAKHLSLNRRIVLDCLLSMVSDAKTPLELQQIYMDHVNEPYLNVNVKYYFGMFKKSYGNIKKIFIENIQRSITECFMDIEIFKSSKNIIANHAICRDLLQSDVFSKAHEKYGVNPIFRRNLSRYFEALEKAKFPLCMNHRG